VQGWWAQLDLGFELHGTRTALVHNRHVGPLMVQRGFYPEGGVCHVYVLHPPGGVVGGDRLDLRVHCAPGAHALLTTPAAGKIYRGAGRPQQVDVALSLSGASLEWLPQETIFYPGAEVTQQLALRADRQSRFVAWEIGCFGLVASGQFFSSGRVVQKIEVQVDGRPLLLERLRLDAAAMQAPWGLASFPVLGTFLAYPVGSGDLEALRQNAEPASDDIRFGLTLVDGVLVGRCFAHHADQVKRRFVSLWERLRPGLMQRPADSPRIWAT
jgi:urease accessory protein